MLEILYYSASWRSNGVLLVSAKIEIKNNINTGNNGTMYHIACWFSIIAVKLNVPDNNTTMITAVLKINSYEIIAAVLLKEPKKAYLELPDQPANNTPYIPKLESAKV